MTGPRVSGSPEPPGGEPEAGFPGSLGFGELADMLPGMVAVWEVRDGTATVLYANAALREFLAPERRTLKGMTADRLLAPDAAEVPLIIAASAEPGVVQVLEREVAGPNGERRSLRVHAKPVTVTDELMQFIAVVVDITDLKQRELELAVSERQLAEAERMAGLGAWETDLRTHEVRWSEGMYRLFGRDPATYRPTEEGMYELVHVDERARTRETLLGQISARTTSFATIRGVRGDGRLHAMQARTDVVVDADGNPARLVGIVWDLSESSTGSVHGDPVDGLPSDLPAAHGRLTARQTEILRLVAAGRSNREIAEQLHISPGTVKWHVKQILAKTGASTRAEAVARVLGGL